MLTRSSHSLSLTHDHGSTISSIRLKCHLSPASVAFTASVIVQLQTLPLERIFPCVCTGTLLLGHVVRIWIWNVFQHQMQSIVTNFYFLVASSLCYQRASCLSCYTSTHLTLTLPTECFVVKETTFNPSHPNSSTLCCLTETSAIMFC